MVTKHKTKLLAVITVGIMGWSSEPVDAYSGGGVLTGRYSSINRAMGGNAHALPTGLEMLYVNPAQLNYTSVFEAGGFFEQGVLDNQTSAAHASFRNFGFPIAVGIASILPKSFTEVSDEGDKDQQSIIETTGGVFAGYEFQMGSQKILTGVGGRFYYGSLLGQTTYSGYFDLGVVLPFRFNAMNFTEAPGFENFYVGLTARNLGPQRSLNGTNIPNPSDLSLSLAWHTWRSRRHSIFLTIGTSQALTSSLEDLGSYSGGLEYEIFELVYARSGIRYDSVRTLLTVGGGFKFNYRNLIQGKVGYGFVPDSILGDSHEFDVKFTFRYANKKEKIAQQTQLQEDLGRDLNADILAIVNDGVKMYRLEHGSYPQHLNKTIPFLKDKYGLESIPKPANGTMFYDAQTGKIKIFDINQLKYRDKLLMTNGSVIIGNIIDEQGSDYIIEHQFGRLTIPKGEVEKRLSHRFSTIDTVVLSTLQEYIQDFKNTHGRYPKSLNELRLYLQKMGVAKFPEPSKGSLIYNPQTGKLDLSTTTQAGTSSGLGKVPGTENSQTTSAKPKAAIDPVFAVED